MTEANDTKMEIAPEVPAVEPEPEATEEATEEAKEEVEEEEAEEKVSEKKTKKAAEPDEAATSGRRSTRDRKTREVYKPVEPTADLEQELVVADGPGEELGTIENVEKRLGTITSTDKLLLTTHALLFPKQKAKKTNRKAHIRKFKGFAPDGLEDAKTAAEEKLDKCQNDDLKALCGLFDVPPTGTKAAMVERIVEFLVKPEASGNEYKKASRKGKTAGTKRKKEKKVKVPRALTGYMFFSVKTQPKIRANKPDIPFKEMGMAVSKQWAKLDDNEKLEWKEKAQAEFEKTGGSKKEAKKAPAKKKAKKAKKEVEEEEEDDDSDDEPLEPKNEGLSDKMEAKLKEILSTADLSVTTRKLIRKQMETEFGKGVKTKKDEINEFIAAFLDKNKKE